MLFILVLIAASAPYVTPAQSPFCSGFDQCFPRPTCGRGASGHLLGTDYLGRDILREAMWGTRASLAVGIVAAAFAAAFGSLWGTVSAFAGGFIDSVMMRIVDALPWPIPSIILLLALNSLITTPGLTSIVACLGSVSASRKLIQFRISASPHRHFGDQRHRLAGSAVSRIA